jgi:CO/xanthine dehydrogenase Mo-binding subunit
MLDLDAVHAPIRPPARAERSVMQLGVGFSTYNEMCGLAPSRILAAIRYAAGGWESATIRFQPLGSVQVVTGTSPHGQGHETAWSQIVADLLGVDPAEVEVCTGTPPSRSTAWTPTAAARSQSAASRSGMRVRR